MPLAAAMEGVNIGPQFTGRSYPSVAKSGSDRSTPPPEPTFGGESLSKGKSGDKTDDTTFNPKEEIAAFRDRKDRFTPLEGEKA